MLSLCKSLYEKALLLMSDNKFHLSLVNYQVGTKVLSLLLFLNENKD